MGIRQRGTRSLGIHWNTSSNGYLWRYRNRNTDFAASKYLDTWPENPVDKTKVYTVTITDAGVVTVLAGGDAAAMYS
jgi:hypothetical protein